MRNIYPKTIFIDENGEMIANDYDRKKYMIKKQWYERKYKEGSAIEEAKTIHQRFAILEEIKTRQLQLEFK